MYDKLVYGGKGAIYMPREKKYVSDEQRKEAQFEAVKRYKDSKKIKRVPLDMPEDELDNLKKFCADHNESVTSFIKSAIKERMERMTGERRYSRWQCQRLIVNIQSFLLRSNQNRQELLSVVHNRSGAGECRRSVAGRTLHLLSRLLLRMSEHVFLYYHTNIFLHKERSLTNNRLIIGHWSSFFF